MNPQSSCIEILESRIAPASIYTFTDLDGDHVKITSSLGNLETAGVVTLTPESNLDHQAISLSLSGSSFNGANITVSVSKIHGDGLALVQAINFGSNNLGSVSITGDLLSISGGADSALPAVKSLNVTTFGRYEGALDSGVPQSALDGDLGSFSVKGNMDAGFLEVTGNISSIKIGGSLIGGNRGFDGDGDITASDNIGTVTIGQDIQGGGGNSGSINAGHSIGSATIHGSIEGGAGVQSGVIGAYYNFTSVTVGGSIFGGSGDESGNIYSSYIYSGTLGKVSVAGSVIGGAGKYSGAIGQTLDTEGVGTIGAVKIGGSLAGGSGDYSGSVGAGESITTGVAVSGSVIGGSGDDSGTIFGAFSAAGTIGKVTIGDSLVGGDGKYSGAIGSVSATHNLSITTLTIGNNLVGGKGDSSGEIIATNGTLGELSLKGSVIGGAGEDSGYFSCDTITSAAIGGNIYGGSGNSSGGISVHDIASITLGGSLIGGSNTDSGDILTLFGTIGVLTIHDDIIGGSGTDSGVVGTAGITTEVIGGAVIPGTGAGSGAITT